MELLKQLFAIHSPSGNEKRIRKFIRRWLRNNVPECTVKGDRFGNMYITKGNADTYPCVAAHLDQVQEAYPADYTIIENNWTISAYSPTNRRTCGLGGDDKCGIWIALNILREAEAVKVAFFAAEEVGCQGSFCAEMAFFDDTRYVVEADRRGAHDLITKIGWGDICSPEFVNAIQPELFGYRETSGLMTDVEALRDNYYPNSCINLSCGYYDPHTDHEFVVKADLLNALNFVRHIVEHVNDVYPFDEYSAYSNDMWYDQDDENTVTSILEYGDYDPTMSTVSIYEDVKDWVCMDKKSLMEIILNWQMSKNCK